MATSTRPPLLLATCLLLALLPAVSLAQDDEYESSVFDNWLAGASCERLQDEALFLRKSLGASKQGVRQWHMHLRVQLGEAHRRYSRRCIEGMRYWSYECLSIRRAIRVLRTALLDEDMVGDLSAERRTLTRRREKIEQRYARVCEAEPAADG